MNLTQEQSEMLLDNGFSSPEELMVYRNYDPSLPGCNLENRFYVFEEGPGYVHNEYEMLDLLMEVAHGPDGLNWRLLKQRLISGTEPSLDGKEIHTYFTDEMTILTPDGKEESFYFDISAHMISMEQDFAYEADGSSDI